MAQSLAYCASIFRLLLKIAVGVGTLAVQLPIFGEAHTMPFENVYFSPFCVLGVVLHAACICHTTQGSGGCWFI